MVHNNIVPRRVEGGDFLYPSYKDGKIIFTVKNPQSQPAYREVIVKDGDRFLLTNLSPEFVMLYQVRNNTMVEVVESNQLKVVFDPDRDTPITFADLVRHEGRLHMPRKNKE